jgi:hypothetical protein
MARQRGVAQAVVDRLGEPGMWAEVWMADGSAARWALETDRVTDGCVK